MGKLKTECFREQIGTRIMKVTGYSEREISELNSMDYRDMKERVLKDLGSVGICWALGYGVYTMWISGSDVMVEIGKSCD